jgi:hypothetical protein
VLLSFLKRFTVILNCRLLGYNEMKQVTPYFENEVLRKRPYLTEEICRGVIENPERKEIQPEGRVRFWAKVEELGNKYLRVITLSDGVSIHNAFVDRGFKPKGGNRP